VNDYGVLVGLVIAALGVWGLMVERQMMQELRAFAASFSLYEPRDAKVRLYGGVHDWERDGEL
jgi:hypothetical protein